MQNNVLNQSDVSSQESTQIALNPKDCTPNAARFISALRQGAGYNAYTILAEIIDNSFDAEANEIDIKIRKHNGEPQIIISDNGYGMDEAILGEALKLGSKTPKDRVSDLGCFGCGLKTSILNMGKKLTVLSKIKDNGWVKAILDVDHILATDRWEIVCPQLDKDDQEIIDKFMPEKYTSGTIIVIDKLDRFTISVTTQVADTLTKHISRIYWKKIQDGLKIKINGEIVEGYDPLEWDDWEVKKIATRPVPSIQENIEVNYTDESGDSKKAIISIKGVCFPPEGENDPNYLKRDKIHPTNEHNSGIYVYRNDREISWGSMLPGKYYHKHTTLTRTRVSISYNADELDFAMSTTYNKTQFDFAKVQQSICDKLNVIIGGFFALVRKHAETYRKTKTADVDGKAHDQSSKKIKEKAKLLALPIGEREKRGPRVNKSDKPSTPTDVTVPRIPRTTQPGKMADTEWRSAKLTAEGPIYVVDLEGKKIIITWNVDHPLYTKITGQEDLIKLMDLMIHGMACAEIKYNYNYNEREQGYIHPSEIISSFKTDMAQNLRILLRD